MYVPVKACHQCSVRIRKGPLDLIDTKRIPSNIIAERKWVLDEQRVKGEGANMVE
jgi:hypothetical protein